MLRGILGRLQDGAGIAAGAVDQTSSEALIVVQQNFQDVQRRKLLMPLAHRKRLRGLNEALERSVYLSMFMSFLSLGLPLEPSKALQTASSLGFRWTR